MITKEEVKHQVLEAIEYDIIQEGDYLPFSSANGQELLYELFDSKEEFKNRFYECNEGKPNLDKVFNLVWKSDFIHFREDVLGDYIYIKEPIH